MEVFFSFDTSPEHIPIYIPELNIWGGLSFFSRDWWCGCRKSMYVNLECVHRIFNSVDQLRCCISPRRWFGSGYLPIGSVRLQESKHENSDKREGDDWNKSLSWRLRASILCMGKACFPIFIEQFVATNWLVCEGCHILQRCSRPHFLNPCNFEDD